ncbi:MAG TPA: glycerate kinase [Gaiellaceae bacterium]|nr:glycerate kinase [Gaiellaceae bacterium]
MLALAAPDKFRGTLTAAEAAAAMAEGARRAGWECAMLPLADGGEGTLDALGGPNRSSRVTGPLDVPVEAAWRLEGGAAVIEAAAASGLTLAGGAQANDPLAATTYGTGELIAAALAAGATDVIVGVGGSATTDGGLGAVEALGWRPFEARVRVACDVRTQFLDAPAVFAPQKGASPDQVIQLGGRLRELALRYGDELGIDVTTIHGSGAAGGLAGGLAALGAELVPGFELIAAELRLEEALDGAGLVLTGEGKLDPTSFDGKVVGGVLAAAARRPLPAIVVAGEIVPGTLTRGPAVSLLERFGRSRAFADPAGCIAQAVADAIGTTATG